MEQPEGSPSRTANWGKPRQSPNNSRQTQLFERSALDSSDEESFVHVPLRADSSTPQPTRMRAGDGVLCSAFVSTQRMDDSCEVMQATPMRKGDGVLCSASVSTQANADSSTSPSTTSSHAGDSVLCGALVSTQRTEHLAGANHGHTSPFRALLVHTNAIWRAEYDSLFTGHIEDGCSIPLFDSSTIHETPEHIDSFDDFSRMCYSHDHHLHYVDLFFQMRYYTGHKKRDKRSSPTSLMKAWEQFVCGYRQSPSFWMHRLQKERERYYNHTTEGAKLKVHQQTIAAGLPCGVRPDQECPFCYSDSPKPPLKARYADTVRYIIPKEVRLLLIELDVRCLNEAADKKEAEEFDEDVLKEEFFNRDATLRMQQQVAASTLEIHRMKRQNLSLAKEVKELKKRSDNLEQQYQQEHAILIDLVQDLSDKIKSGDVSERKRKT